ncbi:MAG: hypothetical protein KAS30_03335 [Candidatus Diapherotrites archaeon]|nr:hypothetical protein [Candidatus Diapherotrites archaeon]
MSITFKKGFITFDFILASLVCLALLSSMIQYAKGLEDASDIHLFRATTKAYTEHTAHLINTVVANQIGQVDTSEPTANRTREFVLGDRFPFPVAADYNLHSCFVWMEDSDSSGSNDILVVKTQVKSKNSNLIEHPSPSNTFQYPDDDGISSYTTTSKTPVTSLATLYNAITNRECENANDSSKENNWCFCNALKIKSEVMA